MGPENQSEDSFERELPSPEELEALLGSTAAEMGSTEFESPEEYGSRFLDDVPPRILLASRSDRDLEYLAALLGKRHVEIAVTRNPFTALDYLRARLFHGMITDYSMWAAQGALLFRRMTKDLDAPVPVVFICDGDRADLEGAKRSAAVDVLERPLDDDRVLVAVGLLCKSRPDADASAGARPEESPMVPEDFVPAMTDESSESSEESAPRGGDPSGDLYSVEETAEEVRGEDAGAEDAAGVATANSWYRFFFEARRALRRQATARRRREHVFELLLATYGASAAAIFRHGDRGGSGVHPCSIRTAYLDRGLSRESRARELKRILRVLADLPEDLLASPGESAPLVTRTALVVPYLSADHADSLLALLPAAGRSLAPPPPAVVEELPILLREIGSLSTDNAR